MGDLCARTTIASRVRRGRILTVVFVFLLPIVNGCISATIISSGKRYENLRKEKTTTARADNKLGRPVWRKEYSSSLPIKDTDEFRLASEKKSGEKPFIWGVHDVAHDAIAASCAVYVRKGPYHDEIRGQAHAMIGALTLGIGDLVMLPVTIRDRWRMSKDCYAVTFWFDQKGHYVASYDGDIRVPSRLDDPVPCP